VAQGGVFLCTGFSVVEVHEESVDEPSPTNLSCAFTLGL